MDVKEFIFNTYKDQAIIGKTFKRDIIKKYKISVIEASDMFTRINNYQINKYGKKLDIDKNKMPSYTAEELNRFRVNANARKYSRRKYER